MIKVCILICFVWKVIFYSGLVNGEKEDTAPEIKKTVLEGYDPSLPPVLFSSNAHYSFINLRIFRIRGLDEKKGELFVEGALVMAWMDERLSWESNNIKKFRVRNEEIWMPSFYVYNGVEPEVTSEPLPVVFQGGAYWEPRYNIRTSCDINLRYYPFDKHLCDIIIASRSNEEDFLTFKKPSFLGTFVQTYFMIKNPQWDHDSPKVFKKNMKINSDFEQEVIVFRFSIQRSMPLIPLGILTPCLSCALLLLTTFWMQAGSTLRAGMCVTSMLVSSSSLFTLGKILPVSGSSTPIIVEYVTITLILSALSSIQTTISSVMRRCEKLPPIPYTTIISKIPAWCLRLMGIAPEKVLTQQLDQKFLFSELDDIENRNSSEREDNNLNVDHKPQVQPVQSLWMKHIILLDRIMFYLLGLIFLLFIISVIVTE